MRKLLLILAIITSYSALVAQTNDFSVSGFVKNKETGEGIAEATVVVKELNKSILVERDASYRIDLKAGRYTFIVSCMGYTTQELVLNVKKNIQQDFMLDQAVNMLDAAVIFGNGNANINRPQMGVERLRMERIKAIPALMGEVDLIKTLQLLPGVQAAAEGSSGFIVRGGTPDQNLVLLDNAPMYNVSHLMGFFSIFNNDAISDIQLYKGDMPASQGGRLSSLLEVNSKDGSMDTFKMSGGIGTISSRLTLEGPIVQDKLSFIVSGRRTYADMFLKLSSDKDLRNSTLYFYDLNAKVNYRVNKNNQLSLTAYLGNDKFSNKLADMGFGNQAGVLRWKHKFSDRLDSDVSLIGTKYKYDLFSKVGDNEYRWKSNIVDYTLRTDFGWQMNPKMMLRFGAAATFHDFSPGNATATSETIDLTKDYALEYVAYASNQHELTDRLTLKYGLRFSVFQNIGPGTNYNFTPDHEKVDSTVYPRGDIYNTYTGFEPRFGAVYKLNSSTSLKASYSHTIQYMHLISNSTSGSPLDVWMPASPNIGPQSADQASVGVFKNFLSNKLETSVEVYYKNMHNVVDFKDHAQLTLNPAIEGELRIGNGESYGVELMLKKNMGRLTGWLSYTLSRSKRTIPEINEGRTYLAPSDRPNNISIVATYEFSKRVSGSLCWLYATGVPVTYPVGRYEFNGTYIPVYDGRNTSRMPDYHRLDLSLTWRGKEKPGRRWHGEWNFSLYNAYGRKNPWYISFEQDKDNPSKTYAEMVYLFSFVPSITYNFTF